MESEKRGQMVAIGYLYAWQIHIVSIFVKMLEICLFSWPVHSQKQAQRGSFYSSEVCLLNTNELDLLYEGGLP